MTKPIHKRKAFGQHFLTDAAWLSRIVEAIAPQPGQCLLEIGAGDGALSLALAPNCSTLVALEIDRRHIAGLRKACSAWPHVEICHADALHFSLDSLTGQSAVAASQGKLRLVGNLPYNISSQLLLHYACCAEIADMHVLIQRELAQRLCATPGGTDYGRFTLATRLWRNSSMLLDIPPQAFLPPPKVWSTLVRLGSYRPLCTSATQLAQFHQLTRVAFGQRRKQLGNSLAGYAATAQLAALGIDPSQRAEQLSIEDFLAIAALEMD